jgi:DNA primase
MALPAGFLDELRARTPLAAVVGRRVKLARSGRNWKGCCPFHSEKTPSFYVYDNGFHCFGCGANGDAISFVMQSQGAAFPEAVEQLAAEAGMEVPKPSAAAAEADRRRLDLHGVLEAAARAFQRRLRLPEGARALRYLHDRALTDATIERFGLGWSGEGRGALAADLAREGVAAEMLIEGGLMKPSDEDRPASDFFFNRVMFPIRDRRGRVISFGGRVLGDGQPKYLNGPETDLFHKRQTLYAQDLAREAARGGAEIVVVEGYMDVIALHQAGFGGAVAPLGTALTEEQFEEIWRLSPMPVLCFDGDAAGGRAAARAAETALPLLTAERSLRLASLPAGEDPDSLVRGQGPPAFQAVLDAARPITDALYDLLRAQTGGNSPEQRAALRSLLETAAGRIGDKFLSQEVRRALLEKFYARPQGKNRRGNPGAPKPPPRFNRPPIIVGQSADERGRNLLAILLCHPNLLHDVEEAFGAVDLPPVLSRLRSAILKWAAAAETLDSQALMSHLTQIGLAADAAHALSAVPYPLPACAFPDAMPAEAEAGWWHIFGLMHRGRLEQEVAAAMRELAERGDDATQRRLIALCTARNALREDENGEAAEP